MESSQQMEVPPWWQTHHGIEDKDSRVLWRNDLEKSQLAFELLSCEPVACAQELEVTHLTNPIQFHAWDPRLITRRRSRDVFDAVYDYIMSEIGSRALVIGAPGVGKSRNFLYLLKRFMETNQLVLYHNVASCLVYAFVPLEQVLNHRVDPAHPHELDALAQDPHRYTAFRTGASGMFKCAAMEKVNTIFLHDPSKRPEAVVSADCRMVLIAPPDRNFFRGYTDYDHRTYFLEPCTVEEAVAFYDILKDAIPGSGRRDPDYGLLTSDEIRKAYADVGGNLWALSTKERLGATKLNQRHAMQRLDDHRIDLLLKDTNDIGLPLGRSPELVHLLTCYNTADPQLDNSWYKYMDKFVGPAADTIMLRLAALKYSHLYGRLADCDSSDYINYECMRILKLLGTLALTIGGKYYVQCLSVLPENRKTFRRPQYTLRLPAATAHSSVEELSTTHELLTHCPVQHVAPFIPEVASPAVDKNAGVVRVTDVHAPPMSVHVFSVPADTKPTPTPRKKSSLFPYYTTCTPFSAPVLPDYPERHLLLTPFAKFPAIPIFGAADHRNRAFVFATDLETFMRVTANVVRNRNIVESGGYTATDPLHVYYVVPMSVYTKVHKAKLTSSMHSDSVIEWIMLLPDNLPGAGQYAY